MPGAVARVVRVAPGALMTGHGVQLMIGIIGVAPLERVARVALGMLGAVVRVARVAPGMPGAVARVVRVAPGALMTGHGVQLMIGIIGVAPLERVARVALGMLGAVVRVARVAPGMPGAVARVEKQPGRAAMTGTNGVHLRVEKLPGQAAMTGTSGIHLQTGALGTAHLRSQARRIHPQLHPQLYQQLHQQNHPLDRLQHHPSRLSRVRPLLSLRRSRVRAPLLRPLSLLRLQNQRLLLHLHHALMTKDSIAGR